ncbi:hypothetical protein PIROE2DRAFT_9174 [Piromyces sp. E2]|nr:hypothetical protein PIROE2DRAFT_9174 [Piromyces sp. E2]|eukprot:OUM64135.1 hypothetical protein PIROE2DRAFT_9174 [Piromyces sp. E2]
MKHNYLFSLFITLFLTVSLVSSEEITLTAGPVTCEYKTKDTDESYNATSDVNIQCSDSSCTVKGSGASFSNSIVSITAAGTYIIQGTLKGQVRIEATKDDFVHLILNGITITSSSGPAIYGVTADKITITLVGENILTDSVNYTVVDEEPDACLFIDSDFAINGTGSLTVTGKYGDAIRCKKDMKIVNGNITIPSAVQRGIKAKNSICIKDGTIDINSTNTGLKVTRTDNAEKGFIVIDGGNITISTSNDGIHSETHLTIRGGYVNISKSKEGLEGQMVDIIGGEIHVKATDDGINASKISDSSSSSSTSNAGGPGGGMQNSGTGTDGSVYINIVGGNDVDGIDSNGVLYIGGEAEVYTSISGGDVYGNMAALDAEGSNAIVSGPTVFVTAGQNSGGRMRKRQGPGGGHSGGNQNGPGGMGNMGESGIIKQPYIQTIVNSQNASTKITVKDSKDNVLGTYIPDVAYSTVLFTSPKMTAGESYTIVTGNDSTKATASEGSNEDVTPPSVTKPSETLESKTSSGYKIKPCFISLLILLLPFFILF